MVIATSQCHEIAITVKRHCYEWCNTGTGRCHKKSASKVLISLACRNIDVMLGGLPCQVFTLQVHHLEVSFHRRQCCRRHRRWCPLRESLHLCARRLSASLLGLRTFYWLNHSDFGGGGGGVVTLDGLCCCGLGSLYDIFILFLVAGELALSKESPADGYEYYCLAYHLDGLGGGGVLTAEGICPWIFFTSSPVPI